jgi:glycosyltransferase involved in cell wall biosynthesis
MTKKILFIGPHRPNRNGSQRFRMEQFFPALRAAGIDFDYSWFLDEKDDRVFYQKGNWPGKFRVWAKAAAIRLGDVLTANRYSTIFIQREAFMTGTVLFERLLSRSRARLVFDFDDAIWLDDVSAQNRQLRWLKRPGKTADLIRLADEVIAGNTFLADYAKQFNRHVQIIPTVVDTEIFAPVASSEQENNSICIGWSGSKTTVKHFATVLPALKKIAGEFGSRVRFKLVGDAFFRTEGLVVEASDFSFENEVHHFRQMDIGLMPLPDDEWSKGKCAFKAIQYMSLAVPPVVSPVGMNTEVVEHEVNGFWASTMEEWVQQISRLVTDSSLRKETGRAARKKIVDHYSVTAHADRFISIVGSR